jgi:type IV pilus assembly protein PilW
MKNVDSQQGLTLLEVLIALTIGTIILLGVIKVLTNSSLAYRMQDGLIRLQANGQFITEYLAKDLRNAGFWGCINDLNAITNQLKQSGLPSDATLYGFTQNLSGSDTASGNPIIKAADALTVHGAISLSGGTFVQTPYSNSTLNIGLNTDVEAGDILFVGDCEQGDIFQVTNITAGQVTLGTTGTPGNLGNTLSKAYDGNAYVYEAYTHVYDIQLNGNGNPGLYLTTAYGSTELVQDVEGMIVLYGEDTDADGSANRYVRASAVGDMNNVVSLRISLLLRSQEESLSPTPQTYTFNGVTSTATDNRLHKVYTSTILLRNRGM